MRTFRSAALAGVGLTLAAAALQAQDRPESLLPPGFGQPAPPSPADAPQSAPSSSGPSAAAPLAPAPAASGASPTPTPSASESVAAEPPRYELPDYARRSLTRVGLDGAEALPADAFGRADGRFLEALMRALDAPIASRWLSIALRRALTSAVDTPANVNGADFAAERAWLLLRMGEAAAARAVVQGVDPANATPKLTQVTLQAALAAGDPAAACAYADTGLARTREAGWVLARAMCLALSGAPAEANAAITAARRRGLGRGIDLNLAEKVVGAGANGRRAVTIEWPGVDRLTSWRWGLAAATGTDVPDDMFATAGPQVRYWHALAPAYPAAARGPDAERATAQGVLSSLALIDLYGAAEEVEESSSAATGIARDLRTAYVGATAGDRLAALRTLWGEPESAHGRYARLVMTAGAAARLRPADAADDADRLIASILSAGYDRNARRWVGAVPTGSEAWALLLVSDPRMRGSNWSEVDGYDGNAARKAMLFASMAGLGRLDPGAVASGADSLGLNFAQATPWSRALDAAARADQPGTVVLLCAIGMQTRDWRGVDPAMLFRITAALRATGLEGYARMIAAEAITRLPA